jgi:hypothetical protein
MKKLALIALGLCLALCGGSAWAQVATGTLVVDIQQFTSDVKLKKKVETTLKSGGIEWGVKDGLVVITAVNKRYVNFDIPYMSRYGTQTTVELPAGDYSITTVGLIPSTAFSPEKLLANGGYFNEKVMSFRIDAGKTTTITVRPVIQKSSTFFLKIFMPELLTTITTDGVASPEVSILAKTDASVSWPNYSGPLKFVVK